MKALGQLNILDKIVRVFLLIKVYLIFYFTVSWTIVLDARC